jgi:predicted cytidylate kinase
LVSLTVSGHPGSGTSTLVKGICQLHGWEYLNGGAVFRSVAQERGLTVEEFSKLCDAEPEVDKSLDERLIIAMQSEDGPEVIESRLCGWWAHNENINCIRLWLEVSTNERANRVVRREGGTHEEAMERILRRMESDQIRYNNLYEISLEDKTPYNLIIESDSLNANEVLNLVDMELKKKGMI